MSSNLVNLTRPKSLTETAWLQTLARPILLVGNGVLTRDVPDKEFSSVVRFNNFATLGMSGEKMTHWVTSGYKNIRYRPVSPAFIPWSKDYQFRRVRHDLCFGKRVRVDTIHTENNDHILEWFPFAITNWLQFPSVGFCFAALLKARDIPFNLIGFDGMKTGHHTFPEHEHEHQHTKVREWELLQEFAVKIIR